MPRPHTAQRSGRNALATYLARRRRQHDRAWRTTPVGFLERLGFDVSRFGSRHRALARASWLPGEVWEMEEAPFPIERELWPKTGLDTGPEELVPGAPIHLSETVEAETNEAIEARAASAPVETMPASRVMEDDTATAVESAPASAVRLPVEPVSAEPAAIHRRARIEEVASIAPRPEAPQMNLREPGAQATMAERGEGPNAGEDVTNSEPVDPARLFEPAGERDLSPAGWARRLARVIAQEQQPKPSTRESAPSGQAPGSARGIQEAIAQTARMPTGPRPRFVPPTSGEGAEPAEALAASTRRFLQPLLGFDPGDVPIVRGAAAGRITGELHAGAAAIGEVVVVRPDDATESPEHLGVLAHELTHVARRRQPRFVPPIARDVQQGVAARASTAGPLGEALSEESLARRVEGRVIRAAKAVKPPPGEWPGDAQASAVIAWGRGNRRRRETIGGGFTALAAPWEGLPGWVSSAPAAPHTAIARSMPPSLPAPAPSESAPSVQLAERGRTVETEVSPPPQTASQPAGKAPVAPDLDALARQVYGILKRRLANEQRREFFS